VAEVNGPDVAAVNSFENPRAVDVREHRRALEGRRFEHRFPAHSVSVLRFATQS
jgi:alpha-L-arabinofuranosidase